MKAVDAARAATVVTAAANPLGIVQPVVASAATGLSEIASRVKALTALSVRAANGLSVIVQIVAANPLVTASRVRVAIAQSALAASDPLEIVPPVQKDHLATIRLAASAPMATASPVRTEIVHAQSVHSVTSPVVQSHLAISRAKAGLLVASRVALLASQLLESRVASVLKASFRARDRAVPKARIAMDPGARAQVANLLEARE
jgi:hypothetical protein